MKTVTQIIANKQPVVWTVKADQLVLDAIKIMAEKEIGALLVTSGDELIGIISERDYAREVILRGKSSHETPISEIMTTNVVTVGSNDSIDRCMELMTEHKIRHLPVMEQGKIVAVLSIGDLVAAIIAEQKSDIQHLEGYIMS